MRPSLLLSEFGGVNSEQVGAVLRCAVLCTV